MSGKRRPPGSYEVASPMKRVEDPVGVCLRLPSSSPFFLFNLFLSGGPTRSRKQMKKKIEQLVRLQPRPEFHRLLKRIPKLPPRDRTALLILTNLQLSWA